MRPAIRSVSQAFREIFMAETSNPTGSTQQKRCPAAWKCRESRSEPKGRTALPRRCGGAALVPQLPATSPFPSSATSIALIAAHNVARWSAAAVRRGAITALPPESKGTTEAAGVAPTSPFRPRGSGVAGVLAVHGAWREQDPLQRGKVIQESGPYSFCRASAERRTGAMRWGPAAGSHSRPWGGH